MAIAGAISYIVLPQATRLGSHGAKTVFSALRWTFITAATLALVIALAARPVIDYAYGAAFDGSVIPLLVMLPGSVCYAAAYVVWAGLGSLNRPGRAAMSQIPGVAITIFGLLAFLGKGGLMAAALVSTIAYASVLILALVLLIRASGLTFRELVTGGLRARLLNTSPDRSVAAYRVE